MDVLGQWITQIIIFILLATIIDLITPTSAMKKYIKLVVGLILILIFLRPVISLFDLDIKESMETSFSTLVQESGNPENMKNLIEMQKKEIQESQHAYILEEMAVQLKEIANTPLIENFYVKISDIDFNFDGEKELAYENLTKVTVYLKQAEIEGGEGSVVAEVEDIAINTDQPIAQAENKNTEQIKEMLADVWEIEDKELTIVWEARP